MLYFAYGSNMNWDQMRERCPSSRFVGIAVLRRYRFKITQESTNSGGGVADVVKDTGANVWGVVYQVSDLDVGKLDLREGYRPGRTANSYERRECMVFLDNDNKTPATVFAYFGNKRESNPPLPTKNYMARIVSGATHWHLPEDYVCALRALPVEANS
jgi:gamma-glutamylcyclotransferase (GGCT)/AIG2-like uncharacterized protein YtfP